MTRQVESSTHRKEQDEASTDAASLEESGGTSARLGAPLLSKPIGTGDWAEEADKKVSDADLARIVDLALEEDLGTGDITGEAIVPENSISTASLLLKEAATIAGMKLFELVMRRMDANISFEALAQDSDQMQNVPCHLARIKGKSRALLAGERTALNLIQRMCGIATLTSQYVQLAQGHKIEILDTRKTTPGLRLIEKWAVHIGGGTNHRYGLYDRILIKDNHRAIAGGVTPAVEAARKNKPAALIEVEVNTFEELAEALLLEVDRVMLDNMTPEQVHKAIAMASEREFKSKRPYIEVSGGVCLSNLKDYLINGVNGISVGALTHSVKNIDISLEFED